MRPIKLLISTAVFAFVLITAFSLWSSQPKKVTAQNSLLSYTEKIDSLRQVKHDFMATDEESPFITQNAVFDSLSYFPVNEKYLVKAMVETIMMGENHALQTSNNKIKNYQEVAILHFDLNGVHEDLTLLQSEDKEHYFLPFYDATSAVTTYGAGRYLEVDYTGVESEINLDFNMAYNPYCAYVEGYSCPVPPAKNQLSIAVEAGEKNYKH